MLIKQHDLINRIFNKPTWPLLYQSVQALHETTAWSAYTVWYEE